MLLKLARFVVSGSIAAAVNLLLLYTLVERVGIYYLIASVCSFLGALGVNFLLQKFWTFNDQNAGRTHAQFLVFVVINLTNIVINTVLMFTFVSVIGFHYLIAQVIAAAIIAVISYLAYQHVVFVR